MQHDPRCGAILCAAEEELAPFLPHLTEEQRLSRAMLTLHIGRIGGLRMVLAATGMCKVNAALAVQTVLDTVSPDFVLNAGTAGGMSPALGLFETAVTTECAYHDVAEAILTESHPHLPSVWFASDPDLLAACRRAAERAPRPRPLRQDGDGRGLHHGRGPRRDQCALCPADGRHGDSRHGACVLCKPRSLCSHPLRDGHGGSQRHRDV